MKKLVNIIWFLAIMVFVCFKHIFLEDNWIFLVMLISFISFYFWGNIRKNKIFFVNFYHIIWGIMLLDMFVSIFFSTIKADAIKFFCVYAFFILVSFILSQKNNWKEDFMGILMIGLTIHLIYTYFQVFFTDIALQMSERILPNEQQALTIRWTLDDMHPKLYAGISGQIGTNAFFFILMIGYLFSYVINMSKNRKKYKKAIYLILTVIALFLTGKKGLIIAGFFSIVYITLVYGVIKYRKNYIYITLIFINTAFIFIQGLLMFGDSTLDKFFEISVSSRLIIYQGMWEGIQKNLLWGNGLNSIGLFTTDGHVGHNIYLQILCEQGIIGCIILILALVIPIGIYTLKLKKYENVLEMKDKSFIYFGLYFQIFMVFYGITGNPFYDYNIVFVYFLIMSGMVSVFNMKYIRRGKICNQ